MPRWDDAGLTEQQRKWFASVRANLEAETGRTLQDWTELARACPETGHRGRLAWMKATHGLGQNRASLVLAEAFPTQAAAVEEDDPLWRDPQARAILEAVRTAVAGIEGLVVGARKGFTGFSRRRQFAAARPVRGGVRLGLALPLEADPRLQRRGAESWSERLTSRLDLRSATEVDDGVAALLRRAAAAS
jgi:hypothetical protein